MSVTKSLAALSIRVCGLVRPSRRIATASSTAACAAASSALTRASYSAVFEQLGIEVSQITLDSLCAPGHTKYIRRQTSDVNRKDDQPVALPEELADMLLESIVDGQFPVESVLPSEGELALKYGMSRLTVREAVRILRSQNIVTIHRGRGTFINPPQAWTSLAAVVRIEEHRSNSGGV